MYWKKQPTNQSTRIIKKQTIDLPLEYEFCFLDLKRLVIFLNCFYHNNERIKIKFLPAVIEWMVKGGIIIGLNLKEKKKLIGVICGSPYRLMIDNIESTGIAVDLLCVREEYRKKNFSPLLMGHLCNTCIDQGYRWAFGMSLDLPYPSTLNCKYIFRCLDVNHLKKIKFYSGYIPPLLKETSYKIAEEEDYNEMYERYKKDSKGYRFYQVFNDCDDFKSYFYPMHTYISDGIWFSFYEYMTNNNTRVANLLWSSTCNVEEKLKVLRKLELDGFHLMHTIPVMGFDHKSLHMKSFNTKRHYYFYNNKIDNLTLEECGFILP